MTGNDWAHYPDLPYEVVVETVNSDGEITHRELVRRHSLGSEASRTLSSARANIVNSETHRAVLDYFDRVKR